MKTFKWSFFIAFLALGFLQCEKSFDAEIINFNDTGKGGSLNKFSIVGDFLYVLDETNIQTYKITDGVMDYIGSVNIGFNIETLYPFENYLLIGSKTGMFIYERSENGLPVYVSSYPHLFACDPVVTDGNYAYVTLSTSLSCRTVNQLDILDISTIQNPNKITSYDMFNPKGLGIDGNLLFICDGAEGLKVFEVTDPINMQLIIKFDHINPVDVIPYNGILLVVTQTALHQFDYSDPDNIHEISIIQIN